LRALSVVKPGLVPGIHDFISIKQDVDGRVKPGHGVARVIQPDLSTL
jgi:hypothetical protein